MRKAFVVLVAAAALTACNSSSSSSGPHVATVIDGEQGLTSFLQCIPRTDTASTNDFDMFPGCANVWDLYDDLSIDDGGNDQWDNAMQLYVGTLPTQDPTFASLEAEYGSLEYFGSVDYGGLTWLTPKLGASQGLPTVVVGDGSTTDVAAIDGNSAFIPPGSGTALRQTLTLTAATPITFTMSDVVVPAASELSGAPDPRFAVVLRDGAGAVLDTLYETSADSTNTGWTADLSAYAGQTVTLSLEFSSDVNDWQYNGAVVDDVSVTDGDATELVQNGDFEDGLTSWTVVKTPEARGVKTAPVTLAGLSVTRSFYALPNSIWGRYADEFVNETADPISTQVVYYTNLGSDDDGIIYDTPGVTGALTEWDGSGSDRDVGVVYGSGTALYESATWDVSGSDDFFIVHDITVPAGGRVTLLTYVLQGGGDTGQNAVDGTERSTEIDTAAAAIVNGYASVDAYRDYLTREQLDTIANF